MSARWRGGGRGRDDWDRRAPRITARRKHAKPIPAGAGLFLARTLRATPALQIPGKHLTELARAGINLGVSRILRRCLQSPAPAGMGGFMRTLRQPSHLHHHARSMRFAPTRSEAALWALLSGSKLAVQFRRQVVLGGRFIVDFCAPSARLVVEVDGPYQARGAAADARRDRALARLGYRVLRLPAALVLSQPEEAAARVREALGTA